MTAGTLALVESPAQFLHALEWCHTMDDPDAAITVLAPRDPVSRAQLRALLDYAEEQDIPAGWCEPRRLSTALPGEFTRLRRAVTTARRLLVGDPFSGLIQALLAASRADDVVVLDDGTATIEFISRLATGGPLIRWDARGTGLRGRLRTTLGSHARRSLLPGPGRAVATFTVMPAPEVPGLVRHPNRYQWTRGRFGSPEVVRGTDVVGSSLVESGVVEPAAYLAAVIALARSARPPGRYYAHRREDDAKLTEIAARTGLRVVRPRVPLEIELRRGPVAERVVGFPSSVGFTLPVVLASVPIEFEVVPIEPGWIRVGVADHARRFLTMLAEPAGVPVPELRPSRLVAVSPEG